MSCTARQPGLVVLTTSELEFAGMTGSSLVMRRCSCTWPVAGSRSMSVSLRSMLPPLGFRLTEMNVGYVGKRPGPHRHPGASGGGVYAFGSGVPERHAREELVEVHVLGWSGIEQVLPGHLVPRAARAIGCEARRAALDPRIDERGLESPQ